MKAKHNLVERVINNNSLDHDLALDVNEKEDTDILAVLPASGSGEEDLNRGTVGDNNGADEKDSLDFLAVLPTADPHRPDFKDSSVSNYATATAKDEDGFLSVLPTDGSTDDLDGSTDNGNEGELISSFRKRPEVTDSTRDEAFSYLQEIARTPLLKPKEETDLFKRFEDGKAGVAELLDQLPESVLAEVCPKVNKRRGARQQSENELWWSPMNLGIVLDHVRQVIEDSHYSNAQGVQSTEVHATEREHLEALWGKLQTAAQKVHDAKLKIVEANLLLVASIAKQHNFNKSSLSFLDSFH